MTYDDLRTNIFDELIAPDEEIRCPFYGLLLSGSRATGTGFFALTDDAFLLSVIFKHDRETPCNLRIPLELARTNVKKNFLGQYTIELEFEDGEIYRMRASHKLPGVDLEFQEEGLTQFIELMSAYER